MPLVKMFSSSGLSPFFVFKISDLSVKPFLSYFLMKFTMLSLIADGPVFLYLDMVFLIA